MHMGHQPRFLNGEVRVLPLTTLQVIIIPGGHVSPFAYSPLARELARKGYATFILRLPFNLGETTTLHFCQHEMFFSVDLPPRDW